MVKNSNDVYTEFNNEVNTRIKILLYKKYRDLADNPAVIDELRMAFKHSGEPLPRLRHVVASYVLDPWGVYYCPMSYKEEL